MGPTTKQIARTARVQPIAAAKPGPSRQHVQVAVRIRPMGSLDRIESVLKAPTHPLVLVPSKKKQLQFDYVFDDTATDAAVFAPVEPLLASFLAGYNATVLAYGQTGSGKSYSMGSDGVNPRGIIPLALEAIFAQLKGDDAWAAHVTFCEIYGDDVRDLYAKQTLLKVTDALSPVIVQGADDGHRRLLDGLRHRTTAATKMNATSSRSHAIFTLHLQQRNECRSLRSKLHFVDLAGSERQKKTLAEGLRFREGVNINKGLLALGNVMNALSEKKAHVPYRDSKLTRLLQDALGGNSQTLMLACVSPAKRHLSETLNSLEYAQRVRKICNNVSLNAVQSDSPAIAELRRQIDALLLEKTALQSQLVALVAQQQATLGLPIAWHARQVHAFFLEAAPIVWDLLCSASQRIERISVQTVLAVAAHPRVRKAKTDVQRHPVASVVVLWIANVGFVLSCSAMYCVDLVLPRLLT
ncbi:hypothetical protein SDRG_03108 [Saprolegnia diclina VS20]|uniref:Kinesin-like protein n=1 Tax=Saprolegnia diclina (strain VS20) TaxID=1156394 RepID=T0QNK6_SAPDV|nr:hypothetical protein SDRG_03108 [Saprolegnia diclina VS20]EQC39679.1 hypothetical protein SDRG_03108 [Saprolegnia diclina VS20]|eukprot:XP_008606951.1 hypothetical protein SDRG_03108 [Saprolegnia diclina VS20]